MIYRFGDCELDDQRSELRREGRAVEVQPKPLALLQFLLEHRDRVVPKDEILDALWPDAVVTEGSLSRAVSMARKAIGDGGKRSWLRSYSRRGYRFVGDVVEVGAIEPETAGAPRVPSTRHTAGGPEGDPFVGREAALGTLREGWEGAASGRGAVVLVSGEAGMGKSRLASFFGEEVAPRGARVLSARSEGTGGAPAFWLWLQILRALARDDDDPELHGLVARLTESGDAASDVASPEQNPFRFYEDVVQVLARASRGRPLVLALEDLHWCRRASLELLEHLATQITSERILVVGTIRDEHRDLGHPLHRTLSILGQLDHVIPLRLQGFSRDEIRALLDGFLGREAPGRLVEELVVRTEGNPLFVREAVRLLEEQGALAFPEASDWRLDRLSERSLDIVRRHFELLPPGCVALLETASVIGRDFTVALLADLEGAGRGDVLDQLDHAVRAGTVEEAAERAGSYRFAHPLFREVAYEHVAPGRRARLHQRAGERLERAHAGHREAVLADLARHYHGGLAVGDPAHAAVIASAAAARATELQAHDQAARHWDQALDAMAQMSPVDPTARLEALLALGEACRLAGDRDRRREVARRAIEAARDLGDPERFARGAIGFCDLGEWSPIDEEAKAALAEALDWLGSRPSSERSRLLTRSGYLSILDRKHAEPTARKAIAVAREIDDADALQEALYALHFALSGPDGVDERRELNGELREVAARASGRDFAVISTVDVACDAILEGDLAGAREARRRAGALAGDRPHRLLLFHLHAFDAGLQAMQGRFAEAERGMRETFLLGQMVGHPYAAMQFLGQTIYMMRDQGRQEELAEHLPPSAHRSPDMEDLKISPVTVGVNAAMALQLGRADDARRLLGLFGPDLALLIGGLDWTAAAVELATVVVALEDDTRARSLYDALRPHAERHAVVPIPVMYNGPIARSLGRLAAVLGELPVAQEHLEDALERCGRLEAWPMQQRIRVDLAHLLRRRGKDRAADALLREAHARALELGMVGVARDAEAALG